MLLQCWGRGEKQMLLCSQSCTGNFRHRWVFVFTSWDLLEWISSDSGFHIRSSSISFHFVFLLLLFSQSVLKHRWSVLYLLLSLSEDPRKPSSRVRVQKLAWIDSLLMNLFLKIFPTELLRSGTTGHCLHKPSPGTLTPPRFTAPGPRVWPWATGRGALACPEVSGPVGSPV